MSETPQPPSSEPAGRVSMPRRRNKTSNINERKRGRGRPPGAMNLEKVAVRDFCRGVLMSEKYRKNVKKVVEEFDPDKIKKIGNIVVLMHYYAFGRPKATIELQIPERRENPLAARPKREVQEVYAKAVELRKMIAEGGQVVYEPASEQVVEPAEPGA